MIYKLHNLGYNEMVGQYPRTWESTAAVRAVVYGLTHGSVNLVRLRSTLFKAPPSETSGKMVSLTEKKKHQVLNWVGSTRGKDT